MTSLDELKARRLALALQRKHGELRATHGENLAALLSPAADRPLSLSDFRMDIAPPFQLCWDGKIEEAPGLVLPNVDRSGAQRVIACVDSKLPPMAGLIGIHGNEFMGLCEVERCSADGMLKAAEATNDSVVFYPSHSVGAILVDCYESNAGPPFSVLVQGVELIEWLRDCFNADT